MRSSPSPDQPPESSETPTHGGPLGAPGDLESALRAGHRPLSSGEFSACLNAVQIYGSLGGRDALVLHDARQRLEIRRLREALDVYGTDEPCGTCGLPIWIPDDGVFHASCSCGATYFRTRRDARLPEMTPDDLAEQTHQDRVAEEMYERHAHRGERGRSCPRCEAVR